MRNPTGQYLVKSTVETDDDTNEPLYWQHDQGWVDRESASRYTRGEVETTPYLPADSIWETEDGSEVI